MRTSRVAPSILRAISIAIMIPTLLVAGCGGGESSGSSEGGSSTGGSGGSSGVAESSSSGSADESTGGLPDLCPDVAVETGIVGRTDSRTCEILADCLMPVTGVEVYLFTENPQVGGSATMPGTLDPAAVPLEDVKSGVGGRFEFQVPAGSYHVCAVTDDGGVLCSDAITLSDDDPVYFVEYVGGIKYEWAVKSCEL